MPRLLSALAAGALALLAGCATVPPEQRAAACAQTDWLRYGLNDGTLGVPASERAEAFLDCQKVGQPADIAAYQQGRAEGLREYCTVEKGYEVGRQGRDYDRVCPPELEPDFLQGLAQGRKERPSYAGVYPNIGIGIGSGGRVRTGVGVGIGLGGYFWDDCSYRSPFPCSWGRGGFWGPRGFRGGRYGCGPFGRSRCW